MSAAAPEGMRPYAVIAAGLGAGLITQAEYDAATAAEEE